MGECTAVGWLIHSFIHSSVEGKASNNCCRSIDLQIISSFYLILSNAATDRHNPVVHAGGGASRHSFGLGFDEGVLS